MTTTPPTRAARLGGLRSLLDFLDAHLQLPVPTTVTIDVHAQNDLEGFEQVARAAARMNVTVATMANGVQRAAKTFGPITYAVVYHPQHVQAGGLR